MTRLTLSRTSCAATSTSFSSTKEMITIDTPSDEVERNSSMPLIVLTASSILSVISVSTCSGAAPGSRVVTRMVGKSTLGNRSTPSRVKANAPMTVSDRIRTDAKTGRRTQISASHCMTDPYSREPVVGRADWPSTFTRRPSASCAALFTATSSSAFTPVMISTIDPTG